MWVFASDHNNDGYDDNVNDGNDDEDNNDDNDDDDYQHSTIKQHSRQESNLNVRFLFLLLCIIMFCIDEHDYNEDDDIHHMFTHCLVLEM